MKKTAKPKRTIPQEIFDSKQNALEQLAAIFPGAVKDGAVDFERLREELGEFDEVGDEKYQLIWAKKQQARREASEDVFGRTLSFVPEESKNPDTTENLYIEGDNLEVLKLLRQNYYAAIKMIYIDPPYNTGNDFVYRDNFTQDEMESELEEGNITAEGERLVRNQRSTNRFHANWLNMMYPRLRIARDILTEDGVIFISIDDNEVVNLRKLCDEIFGAESFIASFMWRRRQRADNRNQTNVSPDHEYIIAYARTNASFLGMDINQAKYKNPDNDPRGPWASIDLTGLATASLRPNLHYDIIDPQTGISYPPNPNRGWSKSKVNVERMIEEGRILFPTSPSGRPREKKFLYELESTKTGFSTCIDNEIVGYTTDGTRELADVFTEKLFPFPKPSSLVKVFVQQNTSDDDTVLDFFSGSGTTAHAVMQLNAEDGGRRKFIMVQIPEKTAEDSEAFKAGYKTIAEIGKERIRRAGEKIKAELLEKQKKNGKSLLDDEERMDPESLDIGFKVFKTDDTMIRWTHESLKSDTMLLDHAMLSDKEKLDFMPYFTDVDVAYEILLRQHDVPLSAKMEPLSKIGKRTYRFADSYVVCLEEKITVKLVEKLAALDPTPIKYVFRDSAFEDDIALKDETLRRLAALIEKNTGEKKKTYTVEFL